ncbi:MAG: hypothetical protein ACR2L2_06695 [Acidobacteriota bacterium]
MLRSILALAAGYVAILVLTIFLFFVLGTFFPNVFLSTPGVLAVLACDFLFAAVGGYVAAALAPHSQLRHTLWLGAILVLFGVVTIVWVGFSPVEGAGKEPLWYQLGRVLVTMPAVLLGGSRQVSRRQRAGGSGQ